MMQQLSAKLRLWGEALTGIDDPPGEYLLNLEERVRRLEGEVEQLRKPHLANSSSAVTPATVPPQLIR